jgi:hypothetical protein
LDFTLRTYLSLLSALQEKGYEFLSFEEFLQRGGRRTVILRHDVDKKPANALKMSDIEKSLGIKASYHFRFPKDNSYRQAITMLASEGHEIAYHYEELDVIFKRQPGLCKNIILSSKLHKMPDNEEYTEWLEQAVSLFESRLKEMRRMYPVKIISMHGSPLSPFDNRDVWKLRNYKDFGIVCEVYSDIDYSSVLYLTDTGRRWDDGAYNMRDRPAEDQQHKRGSGRADIYSFRNTKEIIEALRKDSLQDSMIINTHPQRWNDNIFLWGSEKFRQGLKNFLKKALIKRIH